MTNADKTALKWLAGLAAAGLALTYLSTGRREEDSPLIPNVIEDQLDKLVAWLDGTFGKRWVNRGMDSLQRALSSQMPTYAQFLGAVHAAESSGFRGVQKRRFAMQYLGNAV